MSDKVFVDSNVLIYAHDVDAGPKNRTARTLVTRLWNEGTGLISSQVLQEFYVNVTRKIPSPLPRSTARHILRTYSVWHTELTGPEEILMASELEEEHGLSFWDALIVSAAVKAGASTILSENFNPGQTIAGVLIQNPFLVGS
jgi:predicted nucleic acid-binding protein